ncbi:hypothetical protein BGZ59_008202 [Podila verticillata]|nr:hypothetical protein BGZ59_008202 [Podila verticillata]
MGAKVKLQKSLAIEIEGGQPGGPDEAIIYYGQSDRPTVVHCKIRFTTNYECKGDRIEFCFTGRAVSSWSGGKEVFHRQVWELPVNQPKPGRIAPGSYEASFNATLPPTYPSSSETKGGRVTYLVEAKLRRSWSLDMVELREIWYSATSLPSLVSLAQPIMTVGSCAGVWRDALPYSIIIPSETLFLGQLVPVTIRLGPLLANSPVAGQAIRLVDPRLRLKQYAHLATNSGNSTAVRKKVVVDLTLAHWPKVAVVEYQNTVLMQLPTLPELVPTTRTMVYSVRHSLNLMVGIALSGLAGVMKERASLSFRGISNYEQESGVVVINNKKRFLGMMAACKMNSKWERELWSYKTFYGDKETFWSVFEMIQDPYAFVRSASGVIGERRMHDASAVCGTQLHLDYQERPLWWNGGLIHGGGMQQRRELSLINPEMERELLEDLELRNMSQIILEPADPDWLGDTTCMGYAPPAELAEE